MNTLVTSRIIWAIPVLFICVLVAFAAYVESEHQVDRVNESRLQSYKLAEQLRQSSEGLTIMARSYVITGDSHYKDYYQSILDVRNGNKPRPDYLDNYYAARVNGEPSAPPGISANGIPLLMQLQQLNPTAAEFRKLDEAKANSDALADIEIEAMNLPEKAGPDANQRRQQAIMLLHDLNYLKLKADIIRPIDEYLKLVDQRTQHSFQAAQRHADYVRLVFGVFAGLLMVVLYRSKRCLESNLKETAQANQNYKTANQKLIQQAMVANSTLRKLQLATEVAGMGIWIWEFGLNKLYWDDTMFDIYGVPAAERHTDIPYDYWSARVHHEDLSKTQSALNSAKIGNQNLRNKFRIVLPDGSVRFIKSASVVEHDSHGIPLRMVGINRDITHDIEQQEKTNTALAMANAANVAKNAFLANMSHEVRTPINGVLGMLDLLLDTEMSASQLDCVKTAHSSGLALLEIISDIMDLTELSAHRFELEQIDFNLLDLLEDSCQGLANRAYAKGLELNCLVPPELCADWQGDAKHIRQVLGNLISNAIKFTEYGEIFVTVMQLPIKNGQSGLRFDIHDTGIGIANENIEALFQPFTQVDEATSRRFGGVGLGLSISKKLVDMMGGAIGVDSALGNGSCFWFTLPLAQSEACQSKLPAYELSGKRILVVDGNATRRNIVHSYLTHWGLVVTEMANGDGLLAYLQSATLNGEAYDLILLDQQVTNTDALTLARHLVQLPAIADMAIILLSSESDIDAADHPGTGIVRCLHKPLRQQQLHQAIGAALQGRAGKLVNVPPPNPQNHNYTGKKVLVVEDNKINQKVLVAKLNKFDIVPEVAENGLIALNKLADCRYDLIFMDCHMPVMDGYTATRELRVLEAKQGLSRQTVVAFTANAMEGEFEKCLEAGMDDYITKPIATQQLEAILLSRLSLQ